MSLSDHTFQYLDFTVEKLDVHGELGPRLGHFAQNKPIWGQIYRLPRYCSVIEPLPKVSRERDIRFFHSSPKPPWPHESAHSKPPLRTNRARYFEFSKKNKR